MIIYSSETSVCFTCVEFYVICCDNWFLHKASQNVSSIDLCMRHPVACCGKLQLWYTTTSLKIHMSKTAAQAIKTAAQANMQTIKHSGKE